jgi:hypothetical protein
MRLLKQSAGHVVALRQRNFSNANSLKRNTFAVRAMMVHQANTVEMAPK